MNGPGRYDAALRVLATAVRIAPGLLLAMSLIQLNWPRTDGSFQFSLATADITRYDYVGWPFIYCKTTRHLKTHMAEMTLRHSDWLQCVRLQLCNLVHAAALMVCSFWYLWSVNIAPRWTIRAIFIATLSMVALLVTMYGDIAHLTGPFQEPFWRMRELPVHHAAVIGFGYGAVICGLGILLRR